LTSIHFSGSPKLPSCSSTAGVCLPWTIISCKPPAMGETVHIISGKGLNLNPKEDSTYPRSKTRNELAAPQQGHPRKGGTARIQL
jgi:hypothetical protein